jgi:TonB family protein
MRKLKFASYLIFAAATAVWSQQAPPPKPDQPAPAPIVRDPHSSKADLAVPLCPATFNDSLATDGIVGKDTEGVTPQKAKHMVNAEFSDEARRKKRNGQVIVSFVLGVDGQPQSVCLMQSAGYGLDAKAAEAAQKYVFAPASKDGKPVAMRLHIQVDFHLY